jgi:hypothetical protein
MEAIGRPALGVQISAMTPADLQTIESSLAIRLPEVYRRKVSPFPILCLSGNRDTQLWDDAGALVAYNRKLRARASGWPEYLFAIGQNEGDPGVMALDLRLPDTAPVWFIDHEDPNAAGSGQTHASFDDWVEPYIAGLRQDLVEDGIDPDASPANYAASTARVARWELRLLLFLALGSLGALIILGFLRRHR